MDAEADCGKSRLKRIALFFSVSCCFTKSSGDNFIFGCIAKGKYLYFWPNVLSLTLYLYIICSSKNCRDFANSKIH